MWFLPIRAAANMMKVETAHCEKILSDGTLASAFLLLVSPFLGVIEVTFTLNVYILFHFTANIIEGSTNLQISLSLSL
jgi:hypothetical protein